MLDINNLLKTRISPLNAIIQRATKYIDIVREIIMGNNPMEFKNINQELSSLRDNVNSVPNIDLSDLVEYQRNNKSTNQPTNKPTNQPTEKVEITDKTVVQDAKISNNSFTVIMDLYNKFMTIEKSLHVIIAMFENELYLNLATYNISSSYLHSVRKYKSDTISDYQSYLSISAVDDEKIFLYIFQQVPYTRESIYEFAIKNEFVVNKFTIRLVGRAIEITEGPRRRRLEQMIETQKDIIFNTSRIVLTKYTGAQSTVVRYNLLPITKSLPIEEIFTMCDVTYDQNLTIDENWKLLAAKGHGIVAINNANNSPMEFTIDGLINTEYVMANNLNIPIIAGLNNKILERFDTTKLLPRSTGSSKTTETAIHKGYKDSWYVMESINGVLWRRLAYKGNVSIPADIIAGLELGLTTRPDQYNLIQSDEILKKHIDPKMQLVLSSYMSAVTVKPSSEPIKTAILDEMSKLFEKQVEHIKTPRDLKRLAVDVDEINKILAKLLQPTKVLGKDPSEYMITYLLRFNEIASRFIKELNRRWLIENVQDRLFLDYDGAELHRSLRNIFHNVTTAAINELDSAEQWTGYDQSLKDFTLDNHR